MSQKKSIVQLSDLRITEWYKTRKAEIKQAIEAYPPGYYTFSGDGNTYECVGWSEPKTKKGETEVHIVLERTIPEGTVQLRVPPQYITSNNPARNAQEVFRGFHVSRVVNDQSQYLMLDGQRREFASIDIAKSVLVNELGVPEDQLDNFIYSPA